MGCAHLDEAARLGPVVVLGEVRQRALVEAKGDALALHVLLAHARNHLRAGEEREEGRGRWGCGSEEGQASWARPAGQHVM